MEFDWKTGGVKATHKGHNFDTDMGIFGIERWNYEVIARDALYNSGNSILLQKEDPSLEIKQPDGYLNGKLMDIKGVEGNPMWSINRACKQGVETCVLYFHDPTKFSESDIRQKFLYDLPEWRNKQDYLAGKDMSVNTVVCVVNNDRSFEIVEIKKPED